MPSSMSAAPPKALALAVIGFLLYSVSDAIMKMVASELPITQALAVSSAFSLLPITLMARFIDGSHRAEDGGVWRGLKVGSWPVQFARASVGAGAMCCNVYAFAHMPLADAYAILFSGPLVQSAGAALLLKETMRRRDRALVLTGFVGVLVMLKPGVAGIDLAALSAVAGLICFSASSLIVRRFGSGETRFSFPFFGNLFVCLLLTPVAAPGFVMPDVRLLLLNAAAGMVTGLAMTAVLGAYQMAAVSRVAPLQYSQLVWAVLMGWLVFGDLPTLRLAVGAGLVIASGLALLTAAGGAPKPFRPTTDRR